MENEERVKKPFNKEPKLDDTQANIKEGENKTKRPGLPFKIDLWGHARL